MICINVCYFQYNILCCIYLHCILISGRIYDFFFLLAYNETFSRTNLDRLVQTYPLFLRFRHIIKYSLENNIHIYLTFQEKLIRLLTPEKFAVVGVQLFYCKNFEYNLQKLKDGRGHSTA